VNAVAIHEAAHCAVADYYGHETGHVWANECDGRHGLNPHGWHREYGSERGFRLEEILIYQAGRAAEDHLNGKQNYDDWENSIDHKESWRRALWLSADDEECARLLLQWAARRAELLVRRLWSRIQAIASALCEHGKLSGESVKRIIDESGKIAEASRDIKLV
jgi:hypothetical protein